MSWAGRVYLVPESSPLPILPLYNESLRSSDFQTPSQIPCSPLSAQHTSAPLSPRPVADKLITAWARFVQRAAAWRPPRALQADTTAVAVAINTHRQITQALSGRRARPPSSPSLCLLSELALKLPKLQPISPPNRALLHTTPTAPLDAPYQRASQLVWSGA